MIKELITLLSRNKPKLSIITRKQIIRERLLRRVIQTIRKTLDIEEVKKNIVFEVGKAFQADRCFIRLYHNDTYLSPDCEFLASPRLKSVLGYIFSDDVNSFLRSVHLHNQIIFIPDAKKIITSSSVSAGIKEFCKEFNIKSNYGIPMYSKGELLGAVTLQYSRKKFIPNDDEIELLRIIADQAGDAIKQAQIYTKTKKQAEKEKINAYKERLLRNIISTIRSTLDINEILIPVCKMIAEVFNVQQVIIGDFRGKFQGHTLLAEYKTDESIKGRSYLDPTEYEKLVQYTKNSLSVDGNCLIINDIFESDIPEYCQKVCQQTGIKSILGLPLKDETEIWGGIFLVEHDCNRTWSTEEISLIEIISDHISIAMRQTYLYLQAQQSAKMKSEFLANISHEIRTPLNAIIGFSQMLLSNNYGPLTIKQEKYIDNIATSGTHLLNLINDILDISKIESGSLELSCETFSTKEAIQQTIASLKSLTAQKEINIELQLADININADFIKFKQIMYNLLSNAIKFTPERGRVRVKTDVIENKFLAVIEDTGIGISKKDYNKIFKEFKQLDSPYVRKQEGTGLGLALTKKLIELHKGSIDFESEEKKGSKFWFTIPAAISVIKY